MKKRRNAMANCQNITLIIRMFRIDDPQGKPPEELEQLTFTIVLTNGVIDRTRSTVFLSDMPLSALSGTCQAVADPDGTAMTLFFTWDRIDVFMTGFTYIKGFKRFRGCWFAKTRTGTLENEFNEAQRAIVLSPGNGDTGSGTGQVT
jgi:hypothetical protein